jgi:hypothetical protein
MILLPRFFKQVWPLSIVGLALVLTLISAHAWANEFKIFSLKHRFASDIAPIVAPMVGERGTVSAVQNQLIVRTDANTMREIEAIINSLDTPRVNRKVSFSFDRQTQTERDNTEITGQVRRGQIIVGNDRQSPLNRGRIIIERNTSQVRNNTTQFINVLDGQSAFIRVGQLVPFTQEWVTLTRRYAHIQTNTTFQEVTTGFAVQPTTLNNQVTLSIHPRIAALNAQQTIDFQELSTTITVPLGEWVDIGGMMQQQDEISRKILGALQQQTSQQTGFWIKVD